MDAALDVAHGDDLRTLLSQETGREGADVAETLYGDTGAVDVDAGIGRSRGGDDADTPPGSRLPPRRAAEFDRLAGDDARSVAVAGAVLVHNPGHDLGIRVHVRRWNVALQPEGETDASYELAR